MRITIIAYGTRGDVQPAIALGRAMQSSYEHNVRILASANFKDWIETHGLEAACTQVDIHALLGSAGGIEWVESGNNPLKQMHVIQRIVKGGVGREMMQDAWDAAQGADALISSFTSDVYAVSIAEKLAIKHISMVLQPAMVATRSGAATLRAFQPSRNSVVNYLFGKWVMEPFTWQLYGDVANVYRTEVLGLPPQTQRQNFARMRRMLVVQGFSTHVVPHPADWPANIHTTGYWFLDEQRDWQPTRELEHFLASGDVPICIGFGSMTGRDPQRVTNLVVEAVRQSGVRAILLSGWAGIGDAGLPPSILPMNEVPHEWLFPRMSAVVHHGGAGTTGACLRAGAPSIIVPHFADQPFWGQRVEALGVGPRAIPREKLTSEALANAIRQATTTPAMTHKAAELGALIKAEDGIGRAVGLINDFLHRREV